MSGAVVDSRTGYVFDLPFGVLTLAAGTPASVEPLDFRLASRLLIVRGCPEEKNCATYFHEWTGSTFRLLASAAESP